MYQRDWTDSLAGNTTRLDFQVASPWPLDIGLLGSPLARLLRRRDFLHKTSNRNFLAKILFHFWMESLRHLDGGMKRFSIQRRLLYEGTNDNGAMDASLKVKDVNFLFS